MLTSAIAHGDEVGQHPPLPVDDGEVALVLLHHGNERLLGQLQIGLAEGAEERGGHLDQVGDLLQQLGVGGNLARDGSRQRLRLKADHLLPHLGIDEDTVGLQRRFVIIGAAEGDIGRAGRSRPPGDPSALYPGIRHRDDRLVEQCHQPADGPAEGDARLVPAHGTGEAHPLDPAGQVLRQQLGSRPPLLMHLGDHILSAVHLLHPQVLHGDTLRAGEALGRPGRLPILEGHAGRWPLHHPLLVGLTEGQFLDVDGQPAGRAPDLHRAVVQTQLP